MPRIRRPYRAQIARPKVLVPQTESAAPIEAPTAEEVVVEVLSDLWSVTVFDNDTNTYEEVMTVLMIATGCSGEEAHIEAWEIDHYGSCLVHRDTEDDCRKAADIIAKIGIRVEVSKEA
jgi:ATP-dependent Clp protease adaptor protein ClpS